MITGFNPTDMYAADHIRRVLTTFPGVFSGIGEFTIHKEFVSAKVAGEAASLTNPALDRLLDFAGEVGLVALMHNDIDAPFPKPGQEPYQAMQLRELSWRHPSTTIIWAHMGLGRVVRPVKDQIGIIDRALADPDTEPRLHRSLLGRNGEIHRLVARDDRRHRRSDQSLSRSIPVRHRRSRADQPDRLLESRRMYEPLFARLTPRRSEQVRKGNYVRLFDEARRRVRAWEKANVKEGTTMSTT